MAAFEDTPEGDDAGRGSLADAIAAHLELKKEHGADPERVDAELKDALGPTRRDEPAEPAREPQPAAEVVPEELPPEPEPPAPQEPVPAPEPEPESAAPATETTGTIEFEWDKDKAAEPEPEPEPAAPEHDLLEDTPDFFEETPEHDKLWFDEAPPRKFEF